MKNLFLLLITITLSTQTYAGEHPNCEVQVTDAYFQGVNPDLSSLVDVYNSKTNQTLARSAPVYGSTAGCIQLLQIMITLNFVYAIFGDEVGDELNETASIWACNNLSPICFIQTGFDPNDCDEWNESRLIAPPRDPAEALATYERLKSENSHVLDFTRDLEACGSR